MFRLHLREIFPIFNIKLGGLIMTTQLIFVKGKEFIKKILSGERDFSGIELEEGFDLCGDDSFDELQEYLKK